MLTALDSPEVTVSPRPAFLRASACFLAMATFSWSFASLMQFGQNDPYIDETADDAAERLAKQYRIEWLNDDHAMVSPISLQQRWDYIEAELN